MITNILMVAMIAISISLIVVILIQKKGSGLGSVFGGGGGDAYRSKRGAEKILHYLTILLAFLFATVPFSLLFIK